MPGSAPRVGEAAVNVLGITAQVVHELLELSVDALRFAPVVGLEEAARTLLNIWDALQLVDINRLACLRLTERCATILISVREEIAEAGDDVGIELHAPLNRLVQSFKDVHTFLVKQTHRPFIKRYLQRDEIQRALLGCHNSLTDAMGMFSLSIQIRILKQVLHAEEHRRAETAAILDTISSNMGRVHQDSPRSLPAPPQASAPTNSLLLTGTEVEIWKTLQHPNVLELLGASSASSDPPWFFVSPYLKNGSLVSYLKGLPSLDQADVLKMVHQIAKGMAYLHSKGVLHGDLKAANVLVDDKGHCVISDFGQSEMKSEAYRISGMPLPHGTLRWQAPELMSGQSGLTQEVDVYAFAITCVEIMTKGAIPWPMADDDAVRHFVLRENMRPEPPLQRVWSAQLAEILHACWHRNPAVRPPFTKIDHDVQELRARYGADSPDMHPIPLPLLAPDTTASFIEEESVPSADTSYRTAVGELSVSSTVQSDARVQQGPIFGPEPVPASSRSSSRASSSLQESERMELEYPRHVSPPPPDERAQNLRNERRYRMLLQHEFHPSLTLPLWTPSQVPIGAVGYHSKSRGGEFVVLFNSFDPAKTSGGRAKDIPSLYGYGRVSQGSQRQDKRNVAQRGMDILNSWLSATRSGRGEVRYSRRYSSPLRAGHKTAHLFTEATNYRYIEDLSTPKKWFKANVDNILALYGKEHRISREDLYLVIGTLEAQEHALFVSHEHSDGLVNFNVFSAPRAGQPWGEFSFSFDLSSSFLGGPSYDEPVGSPQYAQKVSGYGNSGRWESVLLARLRFKPDQTEPTSL
ncbi:hypothetical protein BN946_scf184944.g2 [Trametes cinnabarina]|uniref:Protein kinase domain-containing protein n=1 Tax=Pycnoporus cinnabarinus TaxID=5643 RepID=A0A060SQB2_PYCCI|nr:hypothetical protein BN946_scf184944.g2 [Trametes cinnabarina]